jgi:hypothetical protein
MRSRACRSGLRGHYADGRPRDSGLAELAKRWRAWGEGSSRPSETERFPSGCAAGPARRLACVAVVDVDFVLFAISFTQSTVAATGNRSHP